MKILIRFFDDGNIEERRETPRNSQTQTNNSEFQVSIDKSEKKCIHIIYDIFLQI